MFSDKQAVALGLWCCGVTLLVLLTQGQLQHELLVEWAIPHRSRGQDLHSKRGPPACSFGDVDDDGIAEVICAAHAPDDFLSEPTRVAAYDRVSGAMKLKHDVGAKVIAVAARGLVVVVRADGAVVGVGKWLVRPFFAAVDAAVVHVSKENITVVVGGGAETEVAVLDWEGTIIWQQRHLSAEEDIESGFLVDREGPQPQPKTNAWAADPRFWKTISSDDQAVPDDVMSPPSRTLSLVRQRATEIIVRTPRGLVVIDNGTSREVRVPPFALIGDLDGDETLDAVAAVDTASSPPRRNGDEVPPCAAVFTRGLPPVVERTFDASLCHDASVDREIATRRREINPRRRLISTASPHFVDVTTDFGRANRRVVLSDGYDLLDQLTRYRRLRDAAKRAILFTVSRGVTTLLDPATGYHRWLVRGTPSWSQPGGGHLLTLRHGTLAVVSGHTTIALLATSDGTILADALLPLLWDDELILLPPVLLPDDAEEPSTTTPEFLGSGPPLLIVTTQFQTIAVSIRTSLHGRQTLRILVFLAATAAAVLPTIAFRWSTQTSASEETR